MSQVQINQIKKHLEDNFEGIIDISDTHQTGEEGKKAFLTRALSAYAIKYFASDVDNKELAASITDGSDDNGIDSIYYIEETKDLILVQSKWSAEGNQPNLGEIKKFTDGVIDLTNHKFHKFNDKVEVRKEEIEYALLNANTIKVVLAYTGIDLGEHATTEFQELEDKLNDASDLAEVILLDQKKLHKFISHGTSSQDIDLEFGLSHWGKREEPKKAFYGQVTANQIADWWMEHGDNLFTKNIRKLLGDTEINDEIKQTIETEPDNFWYFNNGITMICEELKRKVGYSGGREFGFFECKKIHIINGAQTVGTIGKYAAKEAETTSLEEVLENLEQIYVQIRIICLQNNNNGEQYIDESFANKVTKTNNRQNEIKDQDFIAMDPEQKRIKEELQFEGITYHITRAEDNFTSEKAFDLYESTHALSCAKDLDASTTVHRGTKEIWKDPSQRKYRKLFNPGLTSYYTWNCVQANRVINSNIDKLKNELKNEENAVLTHGRDFITFIIFKLVGTENINKNEICIDDLFNGIDIKHQIRKIVATILEVLDGNQSIVNLFKSYQECRRLYKEIMPSIVSEEEVQEEPLTIDSIIDFKFSERAVKKRINAFYSSIPSDDTSESAFRYWLENMYDVENHECGIISNIQHYKVGEGQRMERFILRIEKGQNLTVYFEYRTEYRSLLYSNPDFKEWLEANTENGFIVIKNQSDIEQLKVVKEFIEKL
ncbi:AIPR family protein [Halalkalibacterium halodurans]|uniref:AIPR family protein n=1 Tax=Halalkalibacterium halodurans TaxID=86665 RepID=UPI002AA9A15B|nr:AIPR family protein [Halalkalibacterium halodurans]MDY7220677.1 AIPR family protein [Halalkalibacterium halodurans]MDY7239916.1 AIPR family protein [Halalkalibacterium halodurans]